MCSRRSNVGAHGSICRCCGATGRGSACRGIRGGRPKPACTRISGRNASEKRAGVVLSCRLMRDVLLVCDQGSGNPRPLFVRTRPVFLPDSSLRKARSPPGQTRYREKSIHRKSRHMDMGMDMDMDMDMDGQFDWMDGHGWTINQLIGHGWTRLHGLLRVVELRAALPKSLLPLRNDESGREAALMLSSERERVRIVSEKLRFDERCHTVLVGAHFGHCSGRTLLSDARCFQNVHSSHGRSHIPACLLHTDGAFQLVPTVTSRRARCSRALHRRDGLLQLLSTSAEPGLSQGPQRGYVAHLQLQLRLSSCGCSCSRPSAGHCIGPVATRAQARRAPSST